MLEGLQINNAKMQSLKEWLKPTIVQQVQSFLGFVQFFHKFIKGFSGIAEPLHALAWKSTSFIWDESQGSAFEQLKQCVVTVPMLEIFDNSNYTEHQVNMDASTKALGAVLLWKHATEASFHPVVYFSRK